MIRRRNDWPERRAEVIEAARRRGYSETYYCAVFPADCVLAMTGVDLMDGYRDLTRAEAEAKLADEHGSLEAFLSLRLGEPIPVAFAQRGDVVVSAEDGQLGVCDGQHSLFVSSDGLAARRTLDCARAYRV